MATFAPSAGARVLLRRFLSMTTEVASVAAHPVSKKTVAEAAVAVAVASEAAHPVVKDANKAARSVSKRVPSEAAHPVAQDANKAAMKDARPLYRRLAALGKAGEGSVSRVLNKWLREGRETRAVDLERYVKELRKYKRHAQALEVRYSPVRQVLLEAWKGARQEEA